MPEGRSHSFSVRQRSVEALHETRRDPIIDRPECSHNRRDSGSQKRAGQSGHALTGQNAAAGGLAGGQDDQVRTQVKTGDLPGQE